MPFNRSCKNAYPGDRCTQFAESLPCHGTEEKRYAEDNRHEDKADQGQLPVEVNEDREDTHHDEDVLEQGNKDRLEHLVEVLHIVCDPGNESPQGLLVKKSDRLFLDRFKEFQADILHNMLAGIFQKIEFSISQPECQTKNEQKDTSHGRHAVQVLIPESSKLLWREPIQAACADRNGTVCHFNGDRPQPGYNVGISVTGSDTVIFRGRNLPVCAKHMQFSRVYFPEIPARNDGKGAVFTPDEKSTVFFQRCPALQIFTTGEKNLVPGGDDIPVNGNLGEVGNGEIKKSDHD